ncbi:hypothetical protein GCM10010406_51880 [Streptomyces thermolineatus]|uniref:Uncharacterized protein n=1 Tax=Streptomyces thermolineatus TaxID=44033 RepID=A0ABP6A8K0_9ACTN
MLLVGAHSQGDRGVEVGGRDLLQTGRGDHAGSLGETDPEGKGFYGAASGVRSPPGVPSALHGHRAPVRNPTAAAYVSLPTAVPEALTRSSRGIGRAGRRLRA